MANEGIKIDIRDLATQTLVCLDAERHLWVTMGFPRNEFGAIDRKLMRNLKGPPYVFQADILDLYDDSHPEGVRLTNAMVIFMHAGREGGGEWVFSSYTDGYPVVATVRAANEYLVRHGMPKIDVVMGCNEYDTPLGIKVGDFLSDEDVVYAVGETVGLRGAIMGGDGVIHFRAEAHDFWHLDEKNIGQHIKISK